MQEFKAPGLEEDLRHELLKLAMRYGRARTYDFRT